MVSAALELALEQASSCGKGYLWSYPVNEHALESDVVDARVQDQQEAPWFWDGGPLVLPVEGNLMVRPGREFRIGDKAFGGVHIKASPFQELSFSF